MGLVIQFLAIAVICGLALWAVSQFPLDASIHKLIRVAVIVVLAVLLLNIILVLLTGRGLGSYLHTALLLWRS